MFAVDILESLKSEGIIKNFLFKLAHHESTPTFVSYEISPAFPSGSTDGWAEFQQRISQGFGRNEEVVFSKAIGEFFERYFLLLYHKTDFLLSSYSSLITKNIPTLNPYNLAGFSLEQKIQYKRRDFDNDSLLYWVGGRRVLIDGKVFIPAQLIYWNYGYHDVSEPVLAVDTTPNGAGGMFTEEGAIISGLYELIERDAFLIHWLNRIVPPRIIPESIPDDEFQEIFKESSRYGFEIYCLNTSLDINVPSFVVAIINRAGVGPYFALGGGCNYDPGKALRKALEEAWSVYYWLLSRPRFELPARYEPFSLTSSLQEEPQDERLRLAANPDMFYYYQFLFSGQEQPLQEGQRFASQKEELNYLVKEVENQGLGYEVFYYSVKHPILDRFGYHSVRVIVPQLVPLYLSEMRVPLGAKRLKEVPRKLGLKAIKGFYHMPHPFP